MKKVLFVALLIMSTATFAQDNTNKGTFEFDTEVIDYGIIAQNSDGKRTFSFKNVGTSPIVISKVIASCGCTVPTKPEKAVLPGETATIEVTYATNRIGKFSKTITIISNASESRKILRIKGNILKNDKNLTVSNK